MQFCQSLQHLCDSLAVHPWFWMECHQITHKMIQLSSLNKIFENHKQRMTQHSILNQILQQGSWLNPLFWHEHLMITHIISRLVFWNKNVKITQMMFQLQFCPKHQAMPMHRLVSQPYHNVKAHVAAHSHRHGSYCSPVNHTDMARISVQSHRLVSEQKAKNKTYNFEATSRFPPLKRPCAWSASSWALRVRNTEWE